MSLESKKRFKHKSLPKRLDSPCPLLQLQHTASDFPCFPYVINTARKTLRTENKPYNTVYTPKTAHFMPWLTSALVTWIAVLNKVSRQERKLEESKSVRYIFLEMFPTRFKPQFSESVLFRRCPRRCPALFRRFLSSKFSVFPVFSWFTCVLFMTTIFLYSLPLPCGKMLQMHKCNE